MSIINDQLKTKYDLLIISAGFEDRTLGSIQKIQGRTIIENVIMNVFHSEEPELDQKNKENMIKMKKVLSQIVKGDIIVVENEPDNMKRFNETLSAYVKDSKNILIDITSFTRLFLYTVLNTSLNYTASADILYSEPQEYTMNFARGLEKIIILPNYPGVPDQSKKILMIMFLGWESRRAESVIEEFDPDLLITFHESSEDRQRDIWNQVTMKQSKKLSERSENYSVSALNPKETLQKLEKIHEKYSDNYDICLVNIGPKSQCLAIAEFSQKHDEVQVLYPKPYKWTQELPESEKADPISSGMGRTYFFQYPLCKKVEK